MQPTTNEMQDARGANAVTTALALLLLAVTVGLVLSILLSPDAVDVLVDGGSADSLRENAELAVKTWIGTFIAAILGIRRAKTAPLVTNIVVLLLLLATSPALVFSLMLA